MGEHPGDAVGVRVHVVAVDGVLADTLPTRGAVLREAVMAVDPARTQRSGAASAIPASLAAAIAELLPGRTFEEAAAALLPAAVQQADPTLVTLVALQAESAWRARCAQGIVLHPAVVAQLVAAQAQGARIVLRADTVRREVDGILQQAGLESLAALVRCADDAPPRRQPSEVLSSDAESSTGRSYRAIAQRLAVWPPIAQCTIHEAGRYATAIAAATLRA